MPECRYTRCRTIEEALECLAAARGEAHVIAGGVALGILMNERLVEPTWLIDIARIEALAGIGPAEAGGLRIGAAVRHREIETSPTLAAAFPMLTEMAAEIACGRIKNRGTIGGNICLADPQGDPPAAVIALRARLRAVGGGGVRDIPATEFFTDVYTTALREDELLQDIVVPAPPAHAASAFGKFSARRAMDYSSTIGAAVHLVRDPASGAIADIGIGLGGVGTTPVWPRATEAALRGGVPGPDLFASMRETLCDEIEPIGDALYSADYKRHVASVILRRTVERAYARAQAREAR